MVRADAPTVVRAMLAIALAGYGIYAAAYIPALLIARAAPMLLLGFVLQATFGLASAFAVWMHRDSAAILIILLGVSVALTALAEAFVLGIVAYLHALFVAAGALILALLTAAYVDDGPPRTLLQ